jgi:poly(3-hydroxyalkanoate) depolymerase
MKNIPWVFETIDLGGQTLRVAIRRGKPHLIPLLMCNGIGASMELLAPFVEALDPDQEVILFDAPGVGGSSTPVFPYRFTGVARYLARMLDHFGYGHVNVFGISWGGFLAQQFAHDYPERCKKLVLVATCSGVIGLPASPVVGLVMASPRRYTDAAYAERVAGLIYGGEFRRNPTLVKAHTSAPRTSSQRGYYYQLGALAGWSSLPWLRQVRQPTLVLAGNDDPLIPLINARLLAWGLPHSELQVVDGGHLFIVSQTQQTARAMETFLGASEQPLGTLVIA